ncbi:MAG: lipoprotein-releasing ABC transporter permease subunit [Pseudomonadota bacterium]
MSFAFEMTVAGRYLRSKRRESFISIIAWFSLIGIMLGVATLIIVMSVMNGFRAELIGRILGLNGHVNVYGQAGPLQNYDPLLGRIDQAAGDLVVDVLPIIEGQALMNVNGNASGVVVRGISEENFNRKPILANSLEEVVNRDGGHFADGWVSIGRVMADRYGLSVGSEVTLIAPKGRASPFGTIPRSRSFRVGSVFDVGMYEYNSSFIFMSLKSAQNFYQMGEGVTALEIITSTPTEPQEVKARVSAAMGDDARVVDWRDTNASFYTALQVERNVMFLILTLIIIVAAFNIISSLIMLVKDKSRDIAILRTMGATKGMIVRIFLMTGASIGFLGTMAGAILGVLFAQNIEAIRQWLEGLTNTELFADEIYFLSRLPAEMDPEQVISIIIMALGLSFAATIYPAWRAARMDPVEGLRNE